MKHFFIITVFGGRTETEMENSETAGYCKGHCESGRKKIGLRPYTELRNLIQRKSKTKGKYSHQVHKKWHHR